MVDIKPSSKEQKGFVWLHSREGNIYIAFVISDLFSTHIQRKIIVGDWCEVKQDSWKQRSRARERERKVD